MKRIVYHIGRGLLAVLILLVVVNACKKEKIEKPETPFQIDSYYPNSGKAGTLVTITGTGFDTDRSKTSVTFNGKEAELISVKGEELVVRAPEEGSTGTVSLNNGSNSAEIGNYTYQSLSVQRVSPANGPAGSHIRIIGEGFSSLAGPAKVTINGKEAIVVSANDTTLLAEIPVDPGSGPVGVSVDGMEAQGQVFTYQAIRTIKPLTGGKGTHVTINGEGFEAVAAGNTVDFNGKTAVVAEASPEKLVVVAPDGVATGPLSVTINGQKTTGPVFTTVPPPTIQSVSPLSGPIGSQMTIKGTQFSTQPDENVVSINGTVVPLTSATSGEIKLTVPEGISSGKVVISVNDQVTEGPVFKNQTLGIVSVSPDNGLAGTSVTIVGTGFSTNAAENTVNFNGIPATVTAATEASLTVTAPAELSTGTLKVTVGGIEAQAPTEFRRAGVSTLFGGPGVTGLNIGNDGGSIAVDDQGNVYVVENINRRVMKITADGQLSIFAGSPSGQAGNKDGQGTEALFNLTYGSGIAIDAQQNVYISDAGNQSIRKITPQGVVSTLVSSVGAIGKMTIDKQGYLYVLTNTGLPGMLKISASGGLSSVPGISGGAGYKPAVDEKGNIYTTNVNNYWVMQQYSLSGTLLFPSFAGGNYGYVDGIGNAAYFATVTSIIPDNQGNLIVLDGPNRSIRQVNIATREVTSLTPQKTTSGFANGTIADAQFLAMADIAIGKDGVIYVLDGGNISQSNNAIRKVFLR